MENLNQSIHEFVNTENQPNLVVNNNSTLIYPNLRIFNIDI